MTLVLPGMVLAQDIKNEDNPDGPALCSGYQHPPLLQPREYF